jgi:Flp pilus assembly pilin Flp
MSRSWPNANQGDRIAPGWVWTAALALCMALPSPQLVHLPVAAAQQVEVPAETFLPRLKAEMRRLVWLRDKGLRTVSGPRWETLTMRWRDGIVHTSEGGVCDLYEVVTDQCLPVAADALHPSTLVWDLHDRRGKLVEQVWLGIFPDAQYVVEQGQVADLAHVGEITQTDRPSVYMLIGVTRPNRKAWWAMWGLGSLRRDDLQVSLLDWDWIFYKTGKNRVTGPGLTDHFVFADEVSIEYGLIAALVAVEIIEALDIVGQNIEPKLDEITDSVRNAGLGGGGEGDPPAGEPCGADAECTDGPDALWVDEECTIPTCIDGICAYPTEATEGDPCTHDDYGIPGVCGSFGVCVVECMDNTWCLSRLPPNVDPECVVPTCIDHFCHYFTEAREGAPCFPEMSDIAGICVGGVCVPGVN